MRKNTESNSESRMGGQQTLKSRFASTACIHTDDRSAER